MVRPGVGVCLLVLLLQACATTGAVGDIESEEDLPADEGGEEKWPPIIDRHFGRWVNKPYDAGRSASALARAEADALEEVKALADLILK